MATMTETAPPARLKTRYLEEIRPQLIGRFGYSSVMQAPRLEKITLNMGVGEAKQDSKALKAAVDQLATIAGQQPSVRRARKSIAAFKLREGMPVGVAVTLRGERSYEFLDRLVSIAIPRIRDFRGLNPRSFDGRGNYSMGVKEQIIFPEVDYDAIDQVRGLDITITTSAATDAEAFALLYAFGMPFAAQGRPKGFNEAAGVEVEAPSDTEEAAAPEPEPELQAASEEPQAPEPEPELQAASEEPQAAAEPEAEAAAEPQAAVETEPEAPAEEPTADAEADSVPDESEASAEQAESDEVKDAQPEQQANAEKESSD
jgi:large subunit ribosomal protein L5